METTPVIDTKYERVIIDSSGIDEKKMKKLFQLLFRERIPISYEQY